MQRDDSLPGIKPKEPAWLKDAREYLTPSGIAQTEASRAIKNS